MRPFDALTGDDAPSPDDTAAAYWLTHPDTPTRRKSFADLITQWETEPEWRPTDEDPECPE